MKLVKSLALFATFGALAACEATDKTHDRNMFDHKDLSQLKAGIWVDPEGCQHWIIDDGVEGYMDLRRTPDGKPVCSDEFPKNTASGPFKAGSWVPDTI
ncbi:MAG: hypothetical protein WCZ23_18030 [Rhodospirillaceae bacterium]